MKKLFREWALVIGLTFLFIAVKYPLLLLMAAVLVGIWKLMAKSTPKPIKEENGASTAAKEHKEYLAEADAIAAEKTVEPECKKSDAFYSGVGESSVIYDKSARFVAPERPIEKLIE